MPETKLEPRAGQPQQQSHGLACGTAAIWP